MRNPSLARPSLKHAVGVAKALGHPARLRILAMLARESPLCVCQMTSVLDVATSTVSGHLNELRRSGLVTEAKTGKLVFYRLDPTSPAADLVRRMVALVADERVEEDRALIQRVRQVPIQDLTQAGLKLERVGIKRRRSGTPSRV
jgi:ArsR family transcriptional regulator, arsenate/arsenite/antimonite-responsive transcriptional repressor